MSGGKIKIFTLANWVSSSVREDIVPWEWTGVVPGDVRKDKARRLAWLTDPQTQHCCYSLVEGVHPALRISRTGAAGGNPPQFLHGLVADFDALVPVEEALARFRGQSGGREFTPPAWAERTLSGHWRCLWLFEMPLHCPSVEWLVAYLSWVAQQLRVDRILPGWDRTAWTDPARYYVTACEWYPIAPESRLRHELVAGWAVQVAEQTAEKARRWHEEAEIPLEDVQRALTERYPRFAAWPGKFVVGARGPTFWIDGSDSLDSAVVTPRGMYTFSAAASQGWWPWEVLLGAAWVNQYKAETLGRQTQGIYYDGRLYYRQVQDGRWVAVERTDILLYLRTVRGVSPRADKQGVSDLERALAHIQEFQRVDVAAPMVYHPPGLLVRHGRLILNTARVQVLAPAEERGAWGEKFPWIGQFLTALLPHQESREVLLAWVQRAYVGALRQQPCAGQVLFLIGSPGVGKTLFTRGLLGRLLGGVAEAGPYLLGEDAFNAELFHCGLWVVDDDTLATDMRRLRRWTAALKRIAANPSHRYHEKFRTAGLVEWMGRCTVTANMDPESAAMLPDLSASVADKLIILRAHPPVQPFPAHWDLVTILDQEMPHFARWLVDWVPPAHVFGDPRYGVRAYMDPDLVPLGRMTSTREQFAELLALWLTGLGATSWRGTSLELLRALHLEPSLQGLLRGTTYNSVASLTRRLQDLADHPSQWVQVSPEPPQYWVITKKEHSEP